jgi:hypothetical protein
MTPTTTPAPFTAGIALCSVSICVCGIASSKFGKRGFDSSINITLFSFSNRGMIAKGMNTIKISPACDLTFIPNCSKSFLLPKNLINAEQYGFLRGCLIPFSFDCGNSIP